MLSWAVFLTIMHGADHLHLCFAKVENFWTCTFIHRHGIVLIKHEAKLNGDRKVQYLTPYLESLGPKAFLILRFSGFGIFIQKNMLRYAISIICSLFFMRYT